MMLKQEVMTAVGAALFSPQTPRLKLMLKASVGRLSWCPRLGTQHSLVMGAKGLLCARGKFLRGSQGRGR
jgi:hypothetical protein